MGPIQRIDELRKRLPSFLFYIKSDVASESRFESDKEVLFSPEERYIENFGWGSTNFKEIMSFFNATNSQLSSENFKGTYERIFNSKENMMKNFSEKGIIKRPFYALYGIKLKSNIRFPILLIDIKKIWKKYCDDCPYNWESEEPKDSKYQKLMMGKLRDKFSDRLELWEILKSKYNCLRTICEEFCANAECKLTFIQNEHLYITDKIECIYNLFNPLFGEDVKPVEIPALGEYVEPKPTTSSISAVKKRRSLKRTICIERPLRFAFEKICYLMIDPKKWQKITNKKTWLTRLEDICAVDGLDKDKVRTAISHFGRMKQANFGVVPSSLIFSRTAEDDRVLVSAPTRSREMLSTFMSLADISSIILEKTELYNCSCGLDHQLIAVPIHTIWKDSDVYRQEAGMLDLLWNKLWECLGARYCQEEFKGKVERKRIKNSRIFRRNFEVSNIDSTSRYADCDYDYFLDLTPLGIDRRLAFSLTTALWRKGGIHEETKTPETYFDQWRELLWNIPRKINDLIAIWYVTVRQTESKVFNEKAPHGSRSMEDLVRKITEGDTKSVVIVDSPITNLENMKLIVVPLFRAYRELDAISPMANRYSPRGHKKYDDLNITKVVEKLLRK